MKTNVSMTRKMGAFKVFQRTKDGMFNATSLLKQWNAQSTTERKMDNYFALQGTSEFIKTIQERENLDTPKLVYVKSRASRGENSGTWMHPMLFIDFAMWMNPSFRYDALKFVYDQMIQYRKDAGDAYKQVSASLATIVNKSDFHRCISKLAEALNWVVFNEHETGMRNKQGDEKSQRELLELEIKVSNLINDGFIKDFDHLINYLRELYVKKYNPKVFLTK